MMQVWLYDKNKVFTESIFVDAVGENMTIEPLLVGYIKPTFNGADWIEGATEKEIKAWEEANKPKPPVIEEDKTDILMAENEKLKLENKQIWDTLEFLLRNTDFVPTGGA